MLLVQGISDFRKKATFSKVTSQLLSTKIVPLLGFVKVVEGFLTNTLISWACRVTVTGDLTFVVTQGNFQSRLRALWRILCPSFWSRTYPIFVKLVNVPQLLKYAIWARGCCLFVLDVLVLFSWSQLLQCGFPLWHYLHSLAAPVSQLFTDHINVISILVL